MGVISDNFFAKIQNLEAPILLGTPDLSFDLQCTIDSDALYCKTSATTGHAVWRLKSWDQNQSRTCQNILSLMLSYVIFLVSAQTFKEPTNLHTGSSRVQTGYYKKQQ